MRGGKRPQSPVACDVPRVSCATRTYLRAFLFAIFVNHSNILPAPPQVASPIGRIMPSFADSLAPWLSLTVGHILLRLLPPVPTTLLGSQPGA